MNKLIFILAYCFIPTIAQSQTTKTEACPKDFIYGAWYDTITNSTAGLVEISRFGFIFGPDSCCSIIHNGRLKECRGGTTKISYKIDCSTNPKQIDIEVFDLTTNSLKSALRFIFEIIDTEHIKIAMSKNKFDKRPQSFNPEEDIDIRVFTKRKNDKNQ